MSYKTKSLTFLILLLLSPAAHAQGPVAKVALVKGDVKLDRAAVQDKTKSVLKLDQFEIINPGDVLELADGAQLTLILRDHRRCTIATAGQYKVDKDRVLCQQTNKPVAIEKDATRSRLSKAEYDRVLALSRPGALVTRSSERASCAPPILPVWDSTLSTDRPTFRWTEYLEQKDGQLYRVDIWENTGEPTRRIIWSKETKDTSVEYDGEPLLSIPGASYCWAVAVQNENQLWTEFPQSDLKPTFRIASPEDREFSARLGEAAQGDDAVEVALCAKALAEKKMVLEAIAAYEHLIQLAPKNVRPRLDLIELYRGSGQTEKAKMQVEECDQLGHRFIDEGDSQSICE